MKKRRSDMGAARGNKRLESGICTRNLASRIPARNPIAFTSWSSWCDPDLDNQTRTDLRRLWWRLRRHGVRLPAERGVILSKGEKR